MKSKWILILILLPALSQGQVVKSLVEKAGGVDVTLAEGILRISPIAEDAIRVKFCRDTDVVVPELVFSSPSQVPAFEVADSPSKLELRGKKIIVSLDKRTGALSFADRSGNIFLSEKAGTRKLIPDSVMGEPCFMAEQSFDSPGDERIFGLGQFQDGYYNLKNVTRRLVQVNSQIALPFIYSSRGYGLLWHQYGLTDFNPADSVITLQKQESSPSGNTQAAEVTTTAGTERIYPHQTLYTGRFRVPMDGEYSIFLDLGDMDNRQYLVIDGTPVIDMTNLWLPPAAGALVHLNAGEHEARVVCRSSNTPKVSWKLTDDLTTFRSPDARLLDYVVFYGPSADSVIAAYRNLSGNVPLLPRWAYGFWQCRERYSSGKQLVQTVGEFRKRNLPMDVIVQDWQYWGNNGWGVPKFDETNYPDPASFIKELHSLNAHLSISIWSNPDRNSGIGKEFAAESLYLPGSKWLDYFNPMARKSYWKVLNDNLFSYGVDSWWMDATEPENDALHGQKTSIGLGDFYRLTYPLFVSRAVYEGQRETTSEKRVCILTRSAFLGQQRYGTINWSGDIGGNWETFRRQIVAGLNYTITGMPYWTTDIGGFFRPGQSQYTDEHYQELLVRWYQWGAFNPIFRIHGYQTETEPWHYGPQVQDGMRIALNLRYRLLPYIYSDAWQVTRNGSTMIRPLAMDFRKDTSALGQNFEYMFGPAILVAPVTEPNVRERNVYLPESTSWYDFWTGERSDGGRTIRTAAPPEKIPLFVRTGSIIPMGPMIQYSTEKSDPLEIRVYPGADGAFTLYEDENDNYDYEKGICATIDFSWNDKTHTLTIGQRQGNFAGMLETRTFNVVLVMPHHGSGVDVTEKVEKAVLYSGTKMAVALK